MSKFKTLVSDRVNHPNHYKGANGIEAIDVVEGFRLGFRIGNAVTYLLRAGHKVQAKDVGEHFAATIEDLQKAQWYIAREIATHERGLQNWERMKTVLERSPRRRRVKKATRR